MIDISVISNVRTSHMHMCTLRVWASSVVNRDLFDQMTFVNQEKTDDDPVSVQYSLN